MLHKIDQPEFRQRIVNLMKSAIDYWLEATGTSKIDLAEQSNIWKVYTDADGWKRTQTLDKYFATETLPKNPKLREVIQTSQFILSHCNHESPQRKKLEDSLNHVKATV